MHPMRENNTSASAQHREENEKTDNSIPKQL